MPPGLTSSSGVRSGICPRPTNGKTSSFSSQWVYSTGSKSVFGFNLNKFSHSYPICVWFQGWAGKGGTGFSHYSFAILLGMMELLLSCCVFCHHRISILLWARTQPLGVQVRGVGTFLRVPGKQGAYTSPATGMGNFTPSSRWPSTWGFYPLPVFLSSLSSNWTRVVGQLPPNSGMAGSVHQHQPFWMWGCLFTSSLNCPHYFSLLGCKVDNLCVYWYMQWKKV